MLIANGSSTNVLSRLSLKKDGSTNVWHMLKSILLVILDLSSGAGDSLDIHRLFDHVRQDSLVTRAGLLNWRGIRDEDVSILHRLFEKGGDRHTTIFTLLQFQFNILGRVGRTNIKFYIPLLFLPIYDIL